MATKQRWEQILEEFWSSDEDTTYTTLERELAERIAELEQQSSYYHSVVNDISLALGWRLGQTYDIQSMLKKIKELQK